MSEMATATCFSEIMNVLNEITSDFNIPRSVKEKVNNVVKIIEDDCETPVKCDKAIQELNVTDDPNVSMFTRTRIWGLISMLEALSNENE